MVKAPRADIDIDATRDANPVRPKISGVRSRCAKDRQDQPGSRLGRRPKRLSGVVMPTRPMADPFGHEVGPVDVRHLFGQIGQRGQRFRQAPRLVHRRDHRVGRNAKLRHLGNTCLQIGKAQLMCHEFGLEMRPLGHRPHTGNPRQTGGSHLQRLTRLTDVRVHRNRRLKRPQRQDVGGGVPRACHDLKRRTREPFNHSQHVVISCSVHYRDRAAQPPVSRSNTALR